MKASISNIKINSKIFQIKLAQKKKYILIISTLYSKTHKHNYTIDVRNWIDFHENQTERSLATSEIKVKTSVTD